MAQAPRIAKSNPVAGPIARIEELLKNNNPGAAKPLCKKLCKKNSNNPQVWFVMSRIHAQLGEYSDAERCCRKVTSLAPDIAVAHYNRALALRKMGRQDDAIACLRKTIRLQPDSINAYVNIGDMLQAAERYEEAIEAYQAVLRIDPAYRDAYGKIAYMQFVQKDTDSAINSYQKVVQLEPSDVSTWLLMASIHASSGALGKAENICTQGLEANPDNVALLCGLGKIVSELGDAKRALQLFQKAGEIEPGNAEIEYLIAAFGQDDASYVEKQKYIAKLFDGYAESFDSHLADQLEYHVPELIHQAALGVLVEDQTSLDILDLGCGTGLCGACFQSIANSLTGVDLSPLMIEKTRQRAIYKTLHQEDIVDVLERSENAYDLVVAADVFIYVGDLSAVFSGCKKALREGGMLVFSVESVDGQVYRLRASGRYGHSEGYILDMATANDFVISTVREITVRKEGNKPIPGQIFVLVKNSGHETNSGGLD